MSSVLACTAVAEYIPGHLAKPEGIVVFPIGRQTGDAGDLRSMKLQLRAAVEFGPKLPGTSWSPRSVRFNYLILIADTAWQGRDEAASRCAARCRRRGPPNLEWRRGVASPRMSMGSQGFRRKTLLNRIVPFQGAPVADRRGAFSRETVAEKSQLENILLSFRFRA